MPHGLSSPEANFPRPGSGLIVLSGGMDSGVLLADALSLGFKLEALSFDYGAKHSQKELYCASLLAKQFSIKHHLINLQFINQLFNSSLLISGQEIPLGSYDKVNMQSTIVPFRNGIMLSIGAGLANSRSLEHLLIGSHGGDHPIYPDCRPEFNIAMSESISAGTEKKVKLSAPYQDLSKQEIANRGIKLGFPFEKTWTCYKGGEIHCGSCASCRERKVALAELDPTSYEEQ